LVQFTASTIQTSLQHSITMPSIPLSVGRMESTPTTDAVNSGDQQEWQEVRSRRGNRLHLSETQISYSNTAAPVEESKVNLRNSRRARRREELRNGTDAHKEVPANLHGKYISDSRSDDSEVWREVQKRRPAPCNETKPLEVVSRAQLRNLRRSKQRAERQQRGPQPEPEPECRESIEDKLDMASGEAFAEETRQVASGDESIVEAAEPEPLDAPDAVVPVEQLKESKASVGAISAEAPIVRPRKHVNRCCSGWSGALSNFEVQEGCFLKVWVDHTSGNGWVYAEYLADHRKQGWLPAYALHELSPHQQWMLPAWSRHEGLHACEMSCTKGHPLLVWKHTRTAEGWVYAESYAAGVDSPSTHEEGWVPVNCLDWDEDVQ